MKTIKGIMMIMMLAMMLTSCSTERRALGQMRTLTHNIETKGDTYTMQDWKNAYDDYREIDARMDVKKLNNEQQKEYGELQARCITSFARCKVEGVVNAVRAYVNQGSGFLRGLVDGLRGLFE